MTPQMDLHLINNVKSILGNHHGWSEMSIHENKHLCLWWLSLGNTCHNTAQKKQFIESPPSPQVFPHGEPEGRRADHILGLRCFFSAACTFMSLFPNNGVFVPDVNCRPGYISFGLGFLCCVKMCVCGCVCVCVCGAQ